MMMMGTAVTLRPSLAFSNQSLGNHHNYNHRPPTQILYRRNIFSKQELQIIQQDLANSLGKLHPETSSSVAHGRRGMVLPNDSKTVQVFNHGSLLDWIIQTTGHDSWKLRHDEVPVEIRSYEQSGAGMSWHKDDVLYTPYPQLEVVWTLENTSDCQTLVQRDRQEIESIQTEVNSVLLVPAGGPEHCVTSLQRGKRIIVKGVYALQECQLLPDTRVPQFKKGSNPTNNKATKRRRKR